MKDFNYQAILLASLIAFLGFISYEVYNIKATDISTVSGNIGIINNEIGHIKDDIQGIQEDVVGIREDINGISNKLDRLILDKVLVRNN